jgi:hypothetical protein
MILRIEVARLEADMATKPLWHARLVRACDGEAPLQASSLGRSYPPCGSNPPSIHLSSGEGGLNE